MAPTPVFLPGESHGRESLVGNAHRIAESHTRLSNFTSEVSIIFKSLQKNYSPFFKMQASEWQTVFPYKTSLPENSNAHFRECGRRQP